MKKKDEYACGHSKCKPIFLDNNTLSFAGYEEWRETKKQHQKCWTCWNKK